MLKKNAKNIVFAAVLVMGLGIFMNMGRTGASDADYVLSEEPEIIAATFSSAWCSSCKILKPRLAKVIPEFADKPIKFVEFDFTLGQRKEISEKAAAAGLAEIYPRFEGATGFTLLVDAETGEIVEMLTMSHTPEAMRAAIAQTIAIASRQ